MLLYSGFAGDSQPHTAPVVAIEAPDIVGKVLEITRMLDLEDLNKKLSL